MNYRKLTLRLNTILFFVVGYICYKFCYEALVLYKMQIQVPLITKKYLLINSLEFCLVLVTIYLCCLLLMRWWFSLVFLLPLLPLPFYVLRWMQIRYNYTQGFINGMIWHKELFNYNINFYLFKGLEDWQKSWVVIKETTQRKNATSFLVYGECRDFFDDPYIQAFFDDFHLDYADSESFERIRGQLDIYTRAKIKLAHMTISYINSDYKAENPIKYYSREVFDYVLEYPERIFLYSIIGIIGGALLFYHLIEEPFYYRIFGRPIIEVASDDSGSEGEGMFDYMIQALGRVNPGTSPDIIYYNLRQIIQDNLDLVTPLNQNIINNINPEISRAVLDKLIPKIYNSQLSCIKIVDYLDNMNSPYEFILFGGTSSVILVSIILIVLIIINKKKIKKKNQL
jgi:hypothetical protein